jgi:hypothetical protein
LVYMHLYLRTVHIPMLLLLQVQNVSFSMNESLPAPQRNQMNVLLTNSPRHLFSHLPVDLPGGTVGARTKFTPPHIQLRSSRQPRNSTIIPQKSQIPIRQSINCIRINLTLILHRPLKSLIISTHSSSLILISHSQVLTVVVPLLPKNTPGCWTSSTKW